MLTTVGHIWHGASTNAPVTTIAADRFWKERARKQPQGQLPHAQALRRRPTTKRKGGSPRHAAPVPRPDTRASSWCVPVHAQHVQGEKKLRKGSEFATRSTWTRKEQEEPPQQQAKEHSQPLGRRAYPTAQGRVETQTNQLSANEHIKEGKDRGALASHEPSEDREPRCNDPVPRSRRTQSSQQLLLRRTWRQIANKSSKGTDDVTSET